MPKYWVTKKYGWADTRLTFVHPAGRTDTEVEILLRALVMGIVHLDQGVHRGGEFERIDGKIWT